MASSSVASTCQSNNVLLVSLLPVRLLNALAAAVGASVLRGLPSTQEGDRENSPPSWTAAVSMCCRLKELDAEQRKGCFSFPLLGFRQPLLPHQCGCGDDVTGLCWEMW